MAIERIDLSTLERKALGEENDMLRRQVESLGGELEALQGHRERVHHEVVRLRRESGVLEGGILAALEKAEIGDLHHYEGKRDVEAMVGKLGEAVEMLRGESFEAKADSEALVGELERARAWEEEAFLYAECIQSVLGQGEGEDNLISPPLPPKVVCEKLRSYVKALNHRLECLSCALQESRVSVEKERAKLEDQLAHALAQAHDHAHHR